MEVWVVEVRVNLEGWVCRWRPTEEWVWVSLCGERMEGMDRWRCRWWRFWSGMGGEVDVVWSLYGVMAVWGGRVYCG